ncbi:hypothetical protein FB451DRAFT_1213569 [Mycena latifolia]|nr:hypothetical protein FB451DRAFT_1213569 [Mycena latifolia]
MHALAVQDVLLLGESSWAVMMHFIAPPGLKVVEFASGNKYLNAMLESAQQAEALLLKQCNGYHEYAQHVETRDSVSTMKRFSWSDSFEFAIV